MIFSTSTEYSTESWPLVRAPSKAEKISGVDDGLGDVLGVSSSNGAERLERRKVDTGLGENLLNGLDLS